ncbi:MAG TPA: amino acid adenylation domain-containing protein, partial [Steroidobacteraceae bacterium]
VARGYLNRPDLTNERFLPDPFRTPQRRMYKTGDLGRYLPDGNIVFLGRNDFQVKIRGLRIELGEIEAQLLACRGVREAVVVAREDTPGDKRLVAYLVPQGDTDLSAGELRTQLAAALPDYMVPAAYVVLPSLPLTPNGKHDRQALRPPEADAYHKRAYEVPTGEVEIAIAGIWQELLHLERIGRHDHFFELGGHSLLAVQLVSRLRQVSGVDVALRDVFASPTLCALAQHVSVATRLALPPIQPADRTQELPLSLAQQRLWFLAQLDPAASVAYHIPAIIHLRGRLDSSVLQRTLDRIIARHEILRTTFVNTVRGEPVQRIAAADIGFALSRLDLRHMPESERGVTIAGLSEDEFRRPFDLSSGPLIRGLLLQLTADHHILLFCQHHLISDGWSIGILVREITALYAAFMAEHPDPLPPLGIQYADYALWQRQWLHDEALQGQAEFWRQHLTGAPALLELPTDHPRPTTQSFAGASIPLTLPPELTAALRAASRRQGATLYMTLLTGWSILLARISGQNDLVIGTPIANRQRLESEPLIGFFVNTLALRIRLEGNPTVTQLLDQVKTATLAAYAHQDVPFEQVVEALQPPRTLSCNPVFQTRFSWNDTVEAGELGLQGLTLDIEPVAQTTTALDLSLVLSDAGETITGVLEYATALFESDTIERLAGYFQTLLTAMAASHEQSVGALPLLSPRQRQQLVVDWNATATPALSERLAHQDFEAHAAVQPHATALVYQDRSLTYGELNAKANQLAHHLLALGIRSNDRVALCVRRSFDMVAGLLAILKAGGAYVPLDPVLPEERLAFMLADSAPVVLLTHGALLDRLPVTSLPPVVVLDDSSTQAAVASLPSDNIDPPTLGLTPAHLAYVIYTSGSTGKPKGVMNIHRGLANVAKAQIELFEVQPRSRVLQLVSFGFDVCISEVTMALCSGASLYLAPSEDLHPGEPLLGVLHRYGITHVSMPVAMLASLPTEATLGTIEVLLAGGEALPAILARQWAGRYRLFNCYGPTETTVCASAYRCRPDEADLVPIGRPLANTTMYLLDEYGQPVPIGVTGELHIGGVQVARGYLNRPDLTQERFLPDPFSATPGTRVYKTGDLGRYLPDGNIVFLGRTDFQVKIRGFRIELGEIEAQLLACRGVGEAVVIAREDSAADKRLVAYVVPNDDTELSVGELRAQLAARLPEYMVPAAYVVLPSLPVTPNGKVDRSVLPDPEADAYLRRAYEAPFGDTEIAIAGIWRELLHIQQIGRHDHFFELGGHSLLAVQLISRLRQELGADVALRELFAAPTLAGFAKRVAEATAIVLAPIQPADRVQSLPLSWAQQRLWFLAQLDPAARAAYHIPATIELRGSLDASALKATLDRIVARH